MARSTEALAVVERVASRALGVVFDSFHVGTQEGELAAALRRVAPHVFAVQLSDAPDRIAPGLRTLDLVGLMRALRGTDVPDSLVEMEFFPTGHDAQAEAWALQALRRLDRQATCA